jgi:hypothetical protein
MNLLAVFGLLITSVIFSYSSRITIMYLFSSLIAMASSLYVFNYNTSGAEAHEGPTFIMFGIIFILVALWQLIMFGSSYYDK